MYSFVNFNLSRLRYFQISKDFSRGGPTGSFMVSSARLETRQLELLKTTISAKCKPARSLLKLRSGHPRLSYVK